MNSGLAALIGALIGGGFSFLGTWLSYRKAWERELWLQKVETLKKVNENFFYPLLDRSQRLKVKQDANEITPILESLRKGRSYFPLLPEQLRENLMTLYFALEKDVMEEKSWSEEDVKDISEKLVPIEEDIHRVYSSVGSILEA